MGITSAPRRPGVLLSGGTKAVIERRRRRKWDLREGIGDPTLGME